MVDPSMIPGMKGETGYLLPRKGRSLHDAFDMDDPAIVKFAAVYTKDNFIRELIITKRRTSFAVVILPLFVFGVAMGSCIWVVNWGLRRIGGE